MIVRDYQENYGSGWVKIYRSLKSHWVWQDNLYFKMWVDFLLRANHSENTILIDSNVIKIERGTFITSLKKLAKEYHCSVGKVRHFLKILEIDSMINSITTHKYTQITICNYDDYQNGQHAERNGNETGMKRERYGNETNKNDKNDKNVKNIGGRMLLEKEYFLNSLPIDLDTDKILAWADWVDYRKTTKKKLVFQTANKKIEFLLKQPDFIACINQSIKNQWQGLFEVNSKVKTNESFYTYREMMDIVNDNRNSTKQTDFEFVSKDKWKRK